MIAQYIVLNETNKILMVLRPYQYYASEAIIEHVRKYTNTSSAEGIEGNG